MPKSTPKILWNKLQKGNGRLATLSIEVAKLIVKKTAADSKSKRKKKKVTHTRPTWLIAVKERLKFFLVAKLA